MSDEDNKVIDLSEARAERDHAAHAAGQSFAFRVYHHDPEGSVGLVPGHHPVVVLTDPATLTGIAMTRATARQLGQELIDAANTPLPEEDP